MSVQWMKRTAWPAVWLSVIAIGLIGCSPTGSYKITALPDDQTLEERIVVRNPGWGSDRIAVIDISGVLLNGREPSLLSEGEHVVSLIIEKLQKAATDSRVKAVVLRINSPGGSVTASDIIYDEIRTFGERTKKPVVAYFQDVAASGGYYIACAADRIIAQRTNVTGSIGVIMQMVDVSQAMGTLGIRADAIKSGPLKDAGSPLRSMKDDERAVFQEIVDGFYAQFLAVVAAGRPNLTKDQIATLADGRVYTAQQALDSGLIDEIGTIHDAVGAAAELAGIKAAHVVLYHRPLSWSPNIYAQARAQVSPEVNILNINMPDLWTRQPSFMYIWDTWD